MISEQRTLASSRDEALERICRDGATSARCWTPFLCLVWLKDTPESRFLAVNQAFANAAGQAGPSALIGLPPISTSSPQHMAEGSPQR